MFHVKQIELNECPVCAGHAFLKESVVKDHMVSGEDFTIVKCSNCEFLATSPRPANEDLGRYYQSEDYLSHNNNQKGWFASAYKMIRGFAVKSKFRLLNKYAGNQSLLDLGCGTGAFLSEVHSHGWTVHGVEPSDTARSFVADELRSVVFEDKDRLPKEARFGAITMWHVLEHVPDLVEHWKFFQERLESNGVLIIAVPNYESRDAKHYGTDWAAWDTPIHLWHFKKSTMTRLAKTNGFDLINIVNMPFDSFYVSLLSEKFRTGKMNVISSFWVGFWSNVFGWRKKNASSLIYVFKKAV